MVAALDHYRAGPQRTGIAHELEAIAGWSSNLAANRLFGMLGGERPIEAALRSLGAASSTYTGTYPVPERRSPGLLRSRHSSLVA